ncbi:hypothetical protein [Octadecabacter dasysiphoniae]|nr:hypothetical protein [Octadecabacter dasysiphoniae]
MKPVFLLIATLGLTACGDIANKNPQAFSSNVRDGQITGTYNPEGWTSDEIQTFSRSNCASGTIASYSEAPQANGLIAFVIDCA